ncbi:cell division protein FtsL [Alkalihalobacillus pseudalcaliphilus]|uniref:cell division protein FtsL n=1 Tax=Alkalihalobacillus pseudalcaliphilus TaxID=79884 RepID=UPI00064DB99A|nr:septum formation initiator family protein [Alkalihalobacillus pseudalcaliphilus]KMK77112.1 hypothetical protein AB990_06055 [Alkalihalobacillus pseudalcaliphilus]
MSMVARNIQHKQQETLQPQRKKVVRRIKHKITKGEKAIMGLIVAGIFLFAAFIIHNYIGIYQTNAEIVQLEQTISGQEEVNAGLSLTVDEYSNPERIIEKAKEQGMFFQGDQVKPVQPQN